MSLSLQEITGKQFFASSDGYDKAEVTAFLEVIASDQQALLDRIEELSRSSEGVDGIGAEVARVLQSARDTSDQLVCKAEESALETRRRLEDEAEMLRSATAQATDRLRQDAEQYSYEVRIAADRAAREQQLEVADRIGRLLAGESTVRERLFALENTLQAMRGDLKDAAEAVLPEIRQIVPPLPPAPPTRVQDEPLSLIDLRDDRVPIGSGGNGGSNGSNGVDRS